MKKIRQDPAPMLVQHIIVDVHTDGTVMASVDGAPLDPPPPAGPWRRSSLGQIINLATGGRATPARVEVREADGTAFTDFITPRSRQEVAAIEEEMIGAVDPTVFATIEESGFVPEEDVAVAVIVGHTEAGPSGMAHVLLDPASVRGGEVVLLGRTSGTLAIRRLR